MSISITLWVRAPASGHNHPAIKEAVVKQLDDGWLYGTLLNLSDSCKEIINLYKSIDMVRFVSTGTEATWGS